MQQVDSTIQRNGAWPLKEVVDADQAAPAQEVRTVVVVSLRRNLIVVAV